MLCEHRSDLLPGPKVAGNRDAYFTSRELGQGGRYDHSQLKLTRIKHHEKYDDAHHWLDRNARAAHRS